MMKVSKNSLILWFISMLLGVDIVKHLDLVSSSKNQLSNDEKATFKEFTDLSLKNSNFGNVLQSIFDHFRVG